MKRITKALALIISICILCVSFSGCISVKDMREQQAYISGDDIVYNNATYKIVKNINSEAYLSDCITRRINLTEKDVPVLLSKPLGNDVEISSNNAIIYDHMTGSVYCREDMLNELNASIESFENNIPKEMFIRDYYGGKSIAITSKQVQTLNSIISSGKKTAVDVDDVYDDDDIEDSNIDISVKLYNDLFVLRNSLFYHDGKYYISNNGDFYEVPKEKNNIIKKIFDKYSEEIGFVSYEYILE